MSDSDTTDARQEIRRMKIELKLERHVLRGRRDIDFTTLNTDIDTEARLRAAGLVVTCTLQRLVGEFRSLEPCN